MAKFIVIQMQIDSESNEPNTKRFVMSNVVRQVDAENKEMAIGKFVVSTQGIVAQKRLDIECYELSKLKSID